jgi:hypothetical protein
LGDWEGEGALKKKAISLLLVLVLGCIGLVACGGGEGSSGGAAPPEEEGTPPSGGGFTWNDMPVYPGANQVQKGSWSMPPAEGDYSKVEWRYYETGDSMSTVASYYRSQMPAKGWQEMGWMGMEAGGYYSKNNEQDGAMIWVGSDEGETFLSLMRATQ